MLRKYIQLAAYIQSVYRWNIRNNPEEIKDFPWNISNTALIMWVILWASLIVLWMFGMLFTPCEWINSGNGETAAYMFFAFASSILISSVLTPVLFVKSQRLRQKFKEVNEQGKEVNFTAFILRLALIIVLLIAFMMVIVSLVRHNCGLSIFAESTS